MKSANFYVWETPAQHFSSWSYAGRLLHLDGSRCHRAQLRVKWSAIEPSPGISGVVFLLDSSILAVYLSTQENKWIPANCEGYTRKCWKGGGDWGCKGGVGTDNPVAGYYPIREENKYRLSLYIDKAEISYCRLGLLHGS